jgi:hypothetical protein
MKALFLLVSLTASGAVLAADDAAVLRCRAIADVPARVACYDAMPLSNAAPAAAAPAAAAARAVAAAPAAPAAPVVAATPAPAANGEQNFGLSGQQLRQQNKEPDTIESAIVGHIEGWGPNTRFNLANGQIWRVADDSQASIMEMDNPKVKLVRNSIGTIFLEIQGTNQAPRVRRVQ